MTSNLSLPFSTSFIVCFTVDFFTNALAPPVPLIVDFVSGMVSKGNKGAKEQGSNG